MFHFFFKFYFSDPIKFFSGRVRPFSSQNFTVVIGNDEQFKDYRCIVTAKDRRINGEHGWVSNVVYPESKPTISQLWEKMIPKIEIDFKINEHTLPDDGNIFELICNWKFDRSVTEFNVSLLSDGYTIATFQYDNSQRHNSKFCFKKKKKLILYFIYRAEV